MAYTTINKSDEYFNTKLYTGNGSTNNITGVNFQPDMVWLKRRSSIRGHTVFDAIRGATYGIYPELTDAESVGASSLTSFDSDGFTLGADSRVNASSETHVAWNWLANGAGSSNTDGTITSTVSANTTSGFSITTYTATGTAGDTVGTGMSSGIDLYFIKRRDVAQSWPVMTSLSNMGAGKYLYLNTTDGVAGPSPAFDNQVAPTSSGVITLGTNATVNASGGTYVCYAFKSIKGFSKIGSYTGNGSTDGTFVYTGFKPAWVMIKRTDAAGYSWLIHDNKRPDYNSTDKILEADLGDLEKSNYHMDLLSNGFKHRIIAGSTNASGGTYIYMAFAEFPTVSSTGTPVTAR